MKPLHEEGRRVIVEANAADVPEPERAARVWQELSRRLDAPLSPIAASASQALGAGAGKTVLSGLGGKVLIGTAAFGLLAIALMAPLGVFRLPNSADPPRPAAATDVRAAVAAPPAQTGTLPAPPSDQAASTLMAETRLIAAAQRALYGPSPAQALALLDQHRAQFPQGELAQERDGARVLTLCRLGRTRDARRARELFLQDWPQSPLIGRVAVNCAKERTGPERGARPPSRGAAR